MVKVKPTASQGRITVRSNNDTTIFGIKDNLSEYYAKLSERWANSPDMINGIDYSSKYYAEKSKESANKAERHKNNTLEAINGFDENMQVAKDDIEQSRINSINTINSTYSVAMWDMQEKSDEVLTSIESLKAEAVDSINSTKTTILNDIEFVAEGEKEEIQELADKAKDDIESTGFYMRDDKLYFINSKGEEEEFKSGGLNDKITNCLLEVPQKIKYTLENGTLTIKAGSVVIVPYGTEDLTAKHSVGSRFLNDTFKVYDTQFADGKFFVWAELINDCSTEYIPTGNNSVQLLLGKSAWHTKELNFDYAGTNNIFSGANAPTTTVKNTVWYDTTNNVIKTSSDKGVTWEVTNNTFPFANANLTANVGVSSVSQVFNGFGYIGSTVWVDKGVKALLPNGINEEGGLNNIEITSQKVSIVTNAGFYQPILYVFNGFGEVSNSTTDYWIYDEVSNHYMHNNDIGHFVILAQSDTTNGVISNFQPKQPFRAVDYNDINNLVPAGTVISSANNSTPSGYLYCNGAAVSRTTYAKLFSAIGTTYGAGDGSTTFNLPNYSTYKFVTSGTVSIKGNGIGIGLTDGTTPFTLSTYSGTAEMWRASSKYGNNVGTGGTFESPGSTKVVGVTTDASKSGITGTIGTATIKWYIKY